MVSLCVHLPVLPTLPAGHSGQHVSSIRYEKQPPFLPDTNTFRNYAIVIVSGFVFLSLVVYVGYGRTRFKGPLVEIVTGLTDDGLALERTIDVPTTVYQDAK